MGGGIYLFCVCVRVVLNMNFISVTFGNSKFHPPRIVVFGWLAIMGSILMMDNLRHRNVVIVNAWPLCLQVEELVDHLLLNCEMAQGMLEAIL